MTVSTVMCDIHTTHDSHCEIQQSCCLLMTVQLLITHSSYYQKHQELLHEVSVELLQELLRPQEEQLLFYVSVKTTLFVRSQTVCGTCAALDMADTLCTWLLSATPGRGDPPEPTSLGAPPLTLHIRVLEIVGHKFRLASGCRISPVIIYFTQKLNIFDLIPILCIYSYK